MMTDVIFKGPAGRIEGKYHQNSNPIAPAVLVLHSDGKGASEMDSEIVSLMFNTFAENGFTVLKFNFRGVGRSDGEQDKTGEGELLDATAALDWLHDKNMESRNFWIAGVSFGSWIALQLVMRRPELEDYVLISPPVKKRDFNFIVPCISSGLVMRGGLDKSAPEEIVKDLVGKLQNKSESKIIYENVPDADAAFTDHIDRVKNALDSYIKMRMVDNIGRIRKIKRDRRRRRKKKKFEGQVEKPSHINPVKPLELD